MPPKTHATLGASSSHRWMECPGSVRLEAEAPREDGPPSEHALEGTAAHALAETCLRQDHEASVYIGSHADDNGWIVTRDMAEAVQVYLDYVRALPGELFIEQRVSLDPLSPPAPMFGTTDAAKWAEDTRTLEIVDYKHGKGVIVYAQDNPQLLYYALGTILKLRVKPDRIVTTIVQPRAHRDRAIDSAEYAWDDLVAYKERLMDAAEAASQPDAPVGPVGDHCRWCRAKAFCPAQHSNALVVAQGEFDITEPEEPSLPTPDRLTDEQILLVLDKASYIEDWFSEVRNYVKTRLEQGEEVPGWKLVDKRATRRWRDEDEAEEWLRQRFKVGEVFSKKLISPYQAEKLVKHRPRLQVPGEMIVSRSSGTHLVPEDHPKPAITAGTEFTDYLEESTNG